MDELESQINDVSQLPDDFLKMPPPYWRSSGAIFHLNNALNSIEQSMAKFVTVRTEAFDRLEAYEVANGLWDKPDSDDVYHEIMNDCFSLELDIRASCEIVCLMAAICAEDLLNCVAVYNLHKDISESIEKLSPLDKLLVISSSLGHHNVKGSVVYEGLKKLVAWRNAFAHGHCVDRPTKSLRHNHLIEPESHPTVPSSMLNAITLAEAFISLEKHTRAISVNHYTISVTEDYTYVENSCKALRQYVFSGLTDSYDVVFVPNKKSPSD